MVIWLIGLSGAGKTTLANKIVNDAQHKNHNVVLLDGDIIREVFDNDLGYSLEDRLVNAWRICKLGKFLSDQGVNVVCSILSIFPETREWNRNHIQDYYEVYIDTPIDILINRDSKGIYERFNRGEITNVAGMDLKFPIPSSADKVINNNKSEEEFLSNASHIVELFKKR